MQLNILKAKIHRATVTHAELHYEGSCAIDGRLLDISGIRECEQIHIYNVNNGARFVTYAIRGEEGSGVISVNGAAAHCAQPGDLVIICAYGVCDEAEAAKYKPTCVYVDRDNAMTHTNRSMPAQAACAGMERLVCVSALSRSTYTSVGLYLAASASSHTP